MLFDDTYKTIAKPAEGVFRDKGSKFIAYAFPAGTEEEAKVFVANVRSAHPKARHHCWALRLGPDKTSFRINDDGEPSGTAGRPILNTLLSAGLTNVIVIVVRYFGGTLLGVPGLINAYKTATSEALKVAEVAEKTINDIYRFNFDYLQMNDVMRIIKEENLHIRKQDYDNDCSVEVEIRKKQLNTVLERFSKVDGLRQRYLYTV
ncbi:putative YigZ family protein [Arcticibacter tournemirensis]|uniref:YigZ family protein n=1 Tax=Arcticibacter tournemirensis TaxID=699437 RepID=A0A5M9GNW9_9SPHI|nr:YigZ family protein [Arcticibacter tournemirensis]KAA8476412.1 YigZ family protein [Arcticibacter tournemirensis]TQM51242.1 putative YigZ family protein [Arcticibacter tournemirensis]